MIEGVDTEPLDRRVKRRDLERISKTTAPGSCAREATTAVPRHREIDFRLTRKSAPTLGIPPPTGSR